MVTLVQDTTAPGPRVARPGTDARGSRAHVLGALVLALAHTVNDSYAYMMSGLMLGLSVGLGGIAVTPFGLIAERFGLGVVVSGTACLPSLGAVMMRFVPRPRSS